MCKNKINSGATPFVTETIIPHAISKVLTKQNGNLKSGRFMI